MRHPLSESQERDIRVLERLSDENNEAARKYKSDGYCFLPVELTVTADGMAFEVYVSAHVPGLTGMRAFATTLRRCKGDGGAALSVRSVYEIMQEKGWDGHDDVAQGISQGVGIDRDSDTRSGNDQQGADAGQA